MKKIIVISCLLLFVDYVCAQKMPDYEGCIYTAIFEWQEGSDHLWHKFEGHRVKRNTKMIVIAHNKKEKLLYTYDDWGCYRIQLTDNWNKYVNKEFNVKKFSNDDLNIAIQKIENDIEKKYIAKNNAIITSIKEEQIRNDSIQKEKKKREEEELSKYRIEHSFHDFKVKEFENNCILCNGNKFHNIIPKRVSGDSLIVFELKSSFLGMTYPEFHIMKLKYRDEKRFGMFLEAYKDSLSSTQYTMEYISEYNKKEKEKFNNELRKVAPNGFIVSWSWSLNSVNGINTYLSYLNTSPKIIKYVDLYFNVYNAVGDRCILKYNNSYVGYIRGVGPVEPFNIGSWSSDASYYTTGDASKLNITKLVITYMDNTKKTLTGNTIIYNTQ